MKVHGEGSMASPNNYEFNFKKLQSHTDDHQSVILGTVIAAPYDSTARVLLEN